MNDAWGFDDNDNAGQGNDTELTGPKALRDAYKAQQKLLEDIQSQLTSERAERTKEKLSSVFENLGVPGAADVYQGEPDPAKAKAWVESMQGVFGNGSAQGSAPPADVTPALDEQAQQQFQRMTEAGQTGTPMGNMESASAAVGSANNIEDLIAAFGRSIQ